jgi:glycine/D-amino acid oxidase-like deaminating enzyme
LAGRLPIIGGGVMGLMTAQHAAVQAQTVTVLDRSQVGDPATASFGLTRSVRNDYTDPEYAQLAFEAGRLWREFELDCGQRSWRGSFTIPQYRYSRLQSSRRVQRLPLTPGAAAARRRRRRSPRGRRSGPRWSSPAGSSCVIQSGR